MKHTESAGGIVVNKKGEVLVVSQHGNSWSLPKGHIDAGEDALAAAKREIAEESGIKSLKLVKPLGSYRRYRIGVDGGDDNSEMKTIHLFLFKTAEERLLPTDPHNPEARWLKKEEVASLLSHSKDKEFYLKVMGQIG